MRARTPIITAHAQDAGHDPGGKVKSKLPQNVSGTAIFSSCRRYRHLLTRDWQAPLWEDPRYVLWIGMNPSTADAEHDDPTIRREIHFTMRLGFSRVVMANVMDYRATNPKDLLSAPVPRSPENIPHIVEAAKDAAVIIAAWGNLHPVLRPCAQAVENALRAIDPAPPIFCLGFTKDGSPRHPLYVPATAPLIPFRSASPTASASPAAGDQTNEAPESKKGNETCAPCAAAAARVRRKRPGKPALAPAAAKEPARD